MNSNAIDPNGGADAETPSPTVLFQAFAHLRRQYTLQYLLYRPGAVALGDLAEYIAIEEGALTRDRYERVLTGLHHLHLPKLVEAGLVEYDVDRETVKLLVNPDTLRPYLKLALPDATD